MHPLSGSVHPRKRALPCALLALMAAACRALQGVELAEMQCTAPAPAPVFSHTEHVHAERHFASSTARRQAGLDGMAEFQPGGPYLPFGHAGFPPGGGR